MKAFLNAVGLILVVILVLWIIGTIAPPAGSPQPTNLAVAVGDGIRTIIIFIEDVVKSL